jgi:hypothetical protein
MSRAKKQKIYEDDINPFTAFLKKVGTPWAISTITSFATTMFLF